MKAALTQAKKALALGEVPIGCVIVHEGKIIGRGYNRRNTDKSTLSHAEISAIVNANEDLTNATIYIFRRDKNKRLNICRPCNACYALIKKTGIKRIVYTILNGFAEEFVC